MRTRTCFPIALAAALLLTTGCGRVTPTGASGLKTSSAGAKTTNGTLAKPVPGTANAPTVNMMATGVGAARGRVIDKATGRPLGGVAITVEPGGQKIVTDATGAFVAQNLVGGNYSFRAATGGLVQEMPAGTLILPNETADVPEIAMIPGTGAAGGASGITAITYVLDREIGRDGMAPALLTGPIGIAVRGNDVMALDTNGSMLVHTGIVRQYDAESGEYAGKYGDYSKWLGFTQMKDTVKAITLDNQGRAVVIDAGMKKLWRFTTDGDKDKATDVEFDAVDLATDRLGNILVAGPAGLTKMNAEAENPQPLGSLGDCRAVAAGKDATWVVTGGKVSQVGADGGVVLELGADGVGGAAAFSDPVDLAVDPRNGHLVVVDKGAKQVYVYDGAGTPIGKVGQGTFESPVAAAVDSTGKVYVVDGAKKKIYKYLPGVTR